MASEPVGNSTSVSEVGGPIEVPDAQSSETLVTLVSRTRLIILSLDDEVIEMVRETAASTARVTCARDLNHLMQSLPNSDPDVLVIDGVNTDIPATIERVARHFPNVVTIIVGTREESSELLQMAAAGRIFRFLLRPLSRGPVRLALTAAIARHSERRGAGQGTDAGRGGEGQRKRSPWLRAGALVTGAVVLGGGVWAASSLMTRKPAPTLATTAAAAVRPPAPKPAAQTDSLQGVLGLAAQALSQGRINDAGGALELYRSILAQDAGNSAALEGIRAIADQLLARAEQSLVAESLDDAQQALSQVQDIDSEHPRLAFLGTQLARERELRNLREQRLQRLVDDARTDMQSGNLLGLVSGGAVAAMLEARKIDPRDPQVVQGVRELTTALVDAVRKAAAVGDTQRARAYTTAAVRLGVGRQALNGMERALIESRQRANSGSVETPTADEGASSELDPR